MPRQERTIETIIRVGSVSVRKDDEDTIEVMHELPPEPWDKALNIVGRGEVVLRIATFWKDWDEQARKDFALALAYISGELVRSLPQRPELEAGT